MADTIKDQMMAYGVAQVIVVLKGAPSPVPAARTSAALAAAIPVHDSRATAGTAEAVVLELGRHFRFSETGVDTALAAGAKFRGVKSAGANWYQRAKSAASRATPSVTSTPPARYFPNLGLMLGTVDQAGLHALENHSRVEKVIAPPVLSLIRPTERTKAKAAKAVTWGIRRLKADKLHAKKITGDGVVVGHLDTGADGKHPALKSAFKAFAEFDMMGFEVTPAPAPHDTDEHGTHTAGTIAGRTIKGQAIGMAPGALLASAIVIEGGNATARVLAGMDWVISHGARILSMSLGFRGFTDDFHTLTQLLRQKGLLPVFAVGNEGVGTSRSPGNYSEALSVGAMDDHDDVADFSGSRRFARADDPLVPDLVAPGVGVISAMPGGGYQQMDGSSMATPHVAGLAALLMQAKPAATIDEIEKAIFDSCSILSGQPADRQNRGVPDAVKALQLLR